MGDGAVPASSIAEPVEWRCDMWDGGCENAFGCGRKVGEFDGRPKAVAFSSSSSSSSSPSSRPLSAAVCWCRRLEAGGWYSVELVMTLSSSLSVSSYSSWLLVPAVAAVWLTM